VVVVSVSGVLAALAAGTPRGDSARDGAAPATTRPRSTSTTPGALLDLGLPPLPELPTYVPAGALGDPPAAGGTVAVFGDSLTLQAWPYLEAIAAHRGQALAGAAYGGAALCDWLPELRRVLRAAAPTDVVLAFAGNNLTPCVSGPGGERLFGEELARRYREHARQAITLARAAGAEVTLVGPPAMRNPLGSAHAEALRTELRDLAGRAGARYVDAAEVLSPDAYTDAQPCLPFETEQLGCAFGRIRVREDDGVHLSAPNAAGYSAGAWRYAVAVLG
jgi:lysophospholipase L1-like esterase